MNLYVKVGRYDDYNPILYVIIISMNSIGFNGESNRNNSLITDNEAFFSSYNLNHKNVRLKPNISNGLKCTFRPRSSEINC